MALIILLYIKLIFKIKKDKITNFFVLFTDFIDLYVLHSNPYNKQAYLLLA